VIRYLKPDKFSIYKNEVLQELLPSKELNQEFLEKIIGVNYKIFKNIMVLSISYNKPFLSMKMN
jgi:hypothetical protein